MRSISIPLISLLLQGVPETVAIVTLANVIAGIPLKWNKILIVGIILAFSAYIIRLFPIPFGIHTFIQIILLFIALTWVGKGDFSLSLIAAIISFIVLIMLEYVCLSLLMPIFGVKKEILATDSIIRIAILEPQVLLLFITAFLLSKFYKKRVD